MAHDRPRQRSGKKTEFVRRERKLSGAQFLQASVFGWLHAPGATRQALYQQVLQTGVDISAAGYEARFNERAVLFLRAMVEEAVKEVFEAETLMPVVEQFNGVYVSDSTRLEGGAVGGIKVAARLELQRGALNLSLETLDCHDNASQVAQLPLPLGALHIGDLAFFDLKRFRHWRQEGVEWVTRYKANVGLYDVAGNLLRLEQVLSSAPERVSLLVEVGHERLPMTLVAQAVSEAIYQQRCEKLKHRARRKGRPVSATRLQLARWTIYLTSVPDLSFDQVHVLYRARWQIERLFKRWKSLGQLASSSTRDPFRQACERYAKLFAVLLAHWLSQAFACAADPPSLDKLFSSVQAHASLIFLAWFRSPSLAPLLDSLFRTIQPALALSRRASSPSTFHLLAHFDELS